MRPGRLPVASAMIFRASSSLLRVVEKPNESSPGCMTGSNEGIVAASRARASKSLVEYRIVVVLPVPHAPESSSLSRRKLRPAATPEVSCARSRQKKVVGQREGQRDRFTLQLGSREDLIEIKQARTVFEPRSGSVASHERRTICGADLPIFNTGAAVIGRTPPTIMMRAAIGRF